MQLDSFQVVLRVHLVHEAALAVSLDALSHAQSPLHRLMVEQQQDKLVAYLDFDGPMGWLLNQEVIGQLARSLDAELIDVMELSDEQRDGLLHHVRSASTPAFGDVPSAFRVLREPPTFTLRLGSDSELLVTWARHVTEGALWLEGAAATLSDLELIIETPARKLTGNRARRVLRPALMERAGAWFEVHAAHPLQRFLAQAHESTHRSPRAPRVLIVDDEAIWRGTLKRVALELGAEVVLASDGRQGLTSLIDGFFELDLMVVDLHMPQIDGRGLIERVRRLGGEQALTIFLVSATSNEELTELGSSGLATKTFSKLDPLETLREALRTALADSAHHRAAA